MDTASNVKYKPVSNAVLIAEILSIQKIIVEEFPDNQTRKSLFQFIRNLEKAVISAAEKQGDIEAVETFCHATEAWWEWVEIYDNEYVRPFRNPSTDPSYCEFQAIRIRCLQNLDEAKAVLRMYRLCLNLNEQANVLANEIILSKFMETLANLDGIITLEQKQYIENILREQFIISK